MLALLLNYGLSDARSAGKLKLSKTTNQFSNFRRLTMDTLAMLAIVVLVIVVIAAGYYAIKPQKE